MYAALRLTKLSSLRLSRSSVFVKSARCIQNKKDFKDLDVIFDLDQADHKPGHEKERMAEQIWEDQYGIKISNAGSHADIISTIQKPMEIEPQQIRHKIKVQRVRLLRVDQQYNEDALRNLGPDLLSGHFLTIRGCKVKLVNDESWYQSENLALHPGLSLLPLEPTNERIEAVDASDSSLMYEGMDYLRGLKEIRYLNLKNCFYIDDFCLHKISLHLQTLEYLDLSNCGRVTERGLATLHTLKNLKKLILKDTENVMHKQLICILLEEKIPGLFIDGVEYDAETIDKELEDDRKMYESRFELREYEDSPNDYLTKQSPMLSFIQSVLKHFPKSSENGFLAKIFPPQASHRDEIKNEF